MEQEPKILNTEETLRRAADMLRQAEESKLVAEEMRDKALRLTADANAIKQKAADQLRLAAKSEAVPPSSKSLGLPSKDD